MRPPLNLQDKLSRLNVKGRKLLSEFQLGRWVVITADGLLGPGIPKDKEQFTFETKADAMADIAACYLDRRKVKTAHRIGPHTYCYAVPDIDNPHDYRRFTLKKITSKNKGEILALFLDAVEEMDCWEDRETAGQILCLLHFENYTGYLPWGVGVYGDPACNKHIAEISPASHSGIGSILLEPGIYYLRSKAQDGAPQATAWREDTTTHRVELGAGEQKIVNIYHKALI